MHEFLERVCYIKALIHNNRTPEAIELTGDERVAGLISHNAAEDGNGVSHRIPDWFATNSKRKPRGYIPGETIDVRIYSDMSDRVAEALGCTVFAKNLAARIEKTKQDDEANIVYNEITERLVAKIMIAPDSKLVIRVGSSIAYSTHQTLCVKQYSPPLGTYSTDERGEASHYTEQCDEYWDFKAVKAPILEPAHLTPATNTLTPTYWPWWTKREKLSGLGWVDNNCTASQFPPTPELGKVYPAGAVVAVSGDPTTFQHKCKWREKPGSAKLTQLTPQF